MLRVVKYALLSAVAAGAALPSAVAAKTTCHGDICLLLTHSKTQVHATPGWRGTGWDHFNVSVQGVGAINGGQQFEARGPFTFPRYLGRTRIYIQACGSGGIFVHSACTPHPAVEFKYRVNGNDACPPGVQGPCGSTTSGGQY
jgi:hypothetical protein